MAAEFAEHELGLSWLPDPGERMQRACHAVATPEGVWLIDPVDVDGIDARIAALGEPAGVIQLLDRHRRDCKPIAGRLGVERHKVPFDRVPGSPFEAVEVVRNRFWNEVALWWPGPRALIVPEAVGTVGYFRAGDEPLGVHPMLRALPPRKQLEGFEPEHLLTGHGLGLHGPGTGEALHGALARSRWRMPRAALSVVRSGFQARRSPKGPASAARRVPRR